MANVHIEPYMGQGTAPTSLDLALLAPGPLVDSLVLLNHDFNKKTALLHLMELVKSLPAQQNTWSDQQISQQPTPGYVKRHIIDTMSF